jgi:arabinosaccharide transport system substrate-binding protein
MSFPLGRPVLVMVLVAAATGLAVLLRPAPPKADLVVWTFAEQHALALTEPVAADRPSLVESYRRKTGRSVRVELISPRAMDVRLVSLLMAGPTGGRPGLVPDLVEIEINSAGLFFRAPAEEVGFVPLNDYLERSGWFERILPARLEAYTKAGMVFGIPHDVHPVAITYRRDLFEQARVDPASARTWAQFQQIGLAYQSYWQGHGEPERRAIELPTASGDMLALMLLGHGVNLVDADGRVHLDDAVVAQAMAQYARMVAGPRAISAPPAPTPLRAAQDLAEGRVAAMITPDWRVAELRTLAPQLAGRLAMMPLPVLRDGDAPTSTWGGTMIAILRGVADADASWDLLEALYLSDEAIAARRHSGILPPLPSAWDDPAYDEPDAFYSGQRTNRLLIDLARQVPARHVTPYGLLAQGRLSLALHRATAAVERDGGPDLEAKCQAWLDEQAEAMRSYIGFAERSAKEP